MTDAVPGYKAKLYTTGDAVAFTGESTTSIGGNAYQIDNSAFTIWDWTQDVTVYENGVESDPDNIRYLSGVIEFDSAPTEPVTVDGSYLPKVEFALGTSVDFSRTSAELEVTVFGDTDIARIYGLQDIEATIEGYQTLLDEVDAGEKSLSDVLEDRDFLVLVYQPDSDNDYEVRAVVMFTEQALSQAVDDLMGSTISMAGAAPRSTFDNQVVFERG